MSARAGIVCVSVVAFCAALGVEAQGPPQNGGPQFILSGTSTVRSWSCPAQGIIKVTPGTSAKAVPGFAHGVDAVVVEVPIANIACEEAEMGAHLREAIKATEYPLIVYALDEYTVAGEQAARATGRLTIAGVTRPVSFDVKLVSSPQGLRTIGETTVDMTQFNVTPPDLWKGLLRVGKDVRIRFDALLTP